MNIQVTNLDNGYNSCEALNTLARTDGEKIIGDLYTTISNLINHWKGADADVHIKDLNRIYLAMIDVVTNAKALTSAAGSAMSAIQEVRRANGGSGQVGALLPSNAPDAALITVPESSGEYYCDPSASTDYTLLDGLCTSFDDFKAKFASERATLMSNWLAGANREKAVQEFQDFESQGTNYSNWLKAARDDLSISNISKVA